MTLVQGVLVTWRNRLRADQAMRYTTSDDDKALTAALTVAIDTLARGETPGWRDIASAPRDGTQVALLFEREDEVLGRLVPRVRAGAWVNGEWSLPHYANNRPTHWAPLPAPPLARSSDAGDPA